MSFSNKKFVAQLTIISLLFLLGLYCGLRFGAISYSQQELLTTFLHPFKETATQDVLLDLRLPRVLAAGQKTSRSGHGNGRSDHARFDEKCDR